MKKFIPLSFIFVLVMGLGVAQAQTDENPVSFNFHYGISGYNGDLGNDMLEVDEEDTDVAYGVGFAFFLNDAFDLALNFNLFELDKNNTYKDDIFAQRGTEFETNVKNLNLMLRWKFLANDDKFNPYLAAGVGGSYLAINEGGTFASADPSNPDNKGFNPGNPIDKGRYIFSIPFGVGLNYEVNSNFTLNFQSIFNRTFTDELDNFPTGNNDEKDGFGNPDVDDNDHDDFLTTTIGVVFNFGGDEDSQMNMQERLLRQSMKNLEAAEESSNEAAQKLQDAEDLNQQTEQALNNLSEQRQQSMQEQDNLRAEMVRVVNNVQFEFDNSEIIEPAYDELNSLAAIMDEYDGLSIDIAARADERGSDSYNDDLSQQRAQAVMDYLVNQGVSSSRISTSALGENSPLMSGNSETAYAQNRSVQLTLSYNGGMMEDDG
jgi:outer membrane protein OmpA-like peptidoglycan-associated protein/outer membrane protein W